MQKFTKKAFSLIEISIVIIIVGVLILLISQGFQMVYKMRIANARLMTDKSPIIAMEDLLLWFEATSENSLATGSAGVFVNSKNPSNNSAIGKWVNLNPNVIDDSYRVHATQDTVANQPTYTKSVINGLPALYFDGVSDVFFITGKNTFSEFTAFFVLRPEYKSTGYSNILNMSNGSGGAGSAFVPSAGGYSSNSISNPVLHIYLGFDVNTALASLNYINSQYPSGYGQISTNAIPNIINNNIIARFNHGYNPSNQSIISEIFVNGIKPTQTTTASSLESSGVLNFRIGMQKDGFTDRNFKGYIGEIILFSKSLSPKESKLVESYLSEKWRIKL